LLLPWLLLLLLPWLLLLLLPWGLLLLLLVWHLLSTGGFRCLESIVSIVGRCADIHLCCCAFLLLLVPVPPVLLWLVLLARLQA
jgi:hypothetical protein